MSFYREPNSEPIPGYRLIEPLGSGGFGEAWKCEAPGGLYKAIKFVFGNLNSLDLDAARAEQERKALDRVKEIRHPFILSMDRIEVVDGELVIVMELADRNLHDAFEECRNAGLVGIPRDRLLLYVRDAAEALDHMNEKYNLQHLDVKPRNLFLVSGRVKVADFGLVKQLERTRSSSIMGGVTPLYAPPETFDGSISGRSDQYSLAVVYQELLTGQRPFQGKNVRQLAQQHLNDPPDLRALPEADRPIVARALSKEPDKRFPNCLAFVRALYNASHEGKRLSGLSSRAAIDGPGGQPEVRGGLHATMEHILLEQMPASEPSVVEGLPDRFARGDGVAGSVSELGMTVFGPQTGALRPTLVIGVGGFGYRSLLELRCRFLDRFGDLDKIPLVHFLALDVDPGTPSGPSTTPASDPYLPRTREGELGESGWEGGSINPEADLGPHEVYHLPLHPVASYRRRSLDQLVEWLPREKLFAMPRSLKTQGNRALGRLAFLSHYHALMARLRREIQQACHPDALYQSVSQTGLALRDNVPRVCVLAALGGGCGGLLLDLGYALRRLLQGLRQPEAPVNAFLYCGAPDDPATPQEEQANVYAALTEFNHFSGGYTSFHAQYGTDGPRITEGGPPFDATYLLTQPHRTPEGRRDVLAHLSNYLFHELATPLGIRLDNLRSRCSPQTPFRSLGTFGVWFPRGLLLRQAARMACRRILREWAGAGRGHDRENERATPAKRWRSSKGSSPPSRFTTPDPASASGEDPSALLESAVARALADPDLVPETLTARLAELAGRQAYESGPTTQGGGLGASHPRDALTHLLMSLDEQVQAGMSQDDPGGWARQAVQRVRDWLGPGVDLSPLAGRGASALHQRKSALTLALERASAGLAEEWDHKLYQASCTLTEYPGQRLALAEAALKRFLAYCEEATQAAQDRLEQHATQSAQARQQLESALENCGEDNSSGLLSWLGQRSRRTLRVLMDRLAAYARGCLAEDVNASVLLFFHKLRGRLATRLEDLHLCRQRLRHLSEILSPEGGDPSMWDERTEETPREEAALHRGRTSSRHSPRGTRHAGRPETSPPSRAGNGEPRTPPSHEVFWESIRGSTTTKVVLPKGRHDLSQAAEDFLDGLTPEQWVLLDQGLGDKILEPLGGLCPALLGHVNLARHLADPLLTQGAEILADMPAQWLDVAEVELTRSGLDTANPSHDGEVEARMRAFHRLAHPLLSPTGKAGHGPSDVTIPGVGALDESDPGKTAWVPPGSRQESRAVAPAVAESDRPPGNTPASRQTDRCFLLIPASDWGKCYGEQAREALPELELVNVPGQSDLMFCREQSGLGPEDLEPLLGPCRASYQQHALIPQTSPHARFDIQDWTPLNP